MVNHSLKCKIIHSIPLFLHNFSDEAQTFSASYGKKLRLRPACVSVMDLVIGDISYYTHKAIYHLTSFSSYLPTQVYHLKATTAARWWLWSSASSSWLLSSSPWQPTLCCTSDGKKWSFSNVACLRVESLYKASSLTSPSTTHGNYSTLSHEKQ